MLRAVMDERRGHVAAGPAEGVLAAFATVGEAIDAAIAGQLALGHESWAAGVAGRMGLAAGELSWEGGECRGATAELAVALCSAAEPGEILVTDGTRSLDHRGPHRLEPVGELQLDGRPEPVDVHRVVTSGDGEVLSIGLLGPLLLRRGGVTLELAGPKRRALLILLALHAGTPISRDRIAELLWPQRSTGREEATLRVHISHLRDVLEPDRQGEPQVLLTRGSSYLLAGEAVEVDIDRFERLVAEARSSLADEPARALGAVNEALALWRGRLLEDVEYEEFAQDWIRRLEMARVEAVEYRAEALIELGENAAAVEDLDALVRAHPTREGPVCLLMRALYGSGRHAESLRVVRRHRRHLAEQGLAASPRVDRLEQRILQHDPTLLPEEVLPSAEIGIGRSVRGYELRQQAGEGSFGVVYRAFQPAVGREVAVKVVHPRLADTPEFVRGFADEARIIAALEHPHIVPLYDFWRDPAGAFVVMRWMDGGSMADRLGQTWTRHELARVFVQLADALGYAHSAGVVHRDVKPANVLFDGGGNAYLADFGLAAAAIDAGAGTYRPAVPLEVERPYAAPELLRGEGPTVAWDVYGLGVLLGQAASADESRAGDTPLEAGIRQVVDVATAPHPADRYPDMAVFAAALVEAVGPTVAPSPRRVRRNPYKGLAPFGEADRADFYGRDDVVENLVDLIRGRGLAAVIGASGSGKSSAVLAGLVPQLRDGALPGSEEWSVVGMVPGTDPFEEFHIALRSVAVAEPTTTAADRSRELRHAFAAALDGPSSNALLVVDQFEEVFSSRVDETTRRAFLDNLVDLATDRSRRFRVVLTLRADFCDRALAQPGFGELVSEGSLLLAPMRPEQVEEAIRRPAARVGVQVEPGLTAEIVRDLSTAPAYLPLLQYVLSELFERRVEDRLAVHIYRSLGGVHGVLERRAEPTFASLGAGAQSACRQLFLRMVHLGEHGEETRRRLPLSELQGLGRRADVDEALEAFAAARLLTYDRDPLSRTPTVEVAHETVIQRWTRYRLWIDEARADLLAHRRVAAAASTWATAEEDPSYLLTGGPLAAAVELEAGHRVVLNAVESRFVEESRRAGEAAREHEEDRRRREAALTERARRRLALGLAAAAVAGLVAVAAALAWVERQRADDLAAARERESTAQRLASSALATLSIDPELSLLLAIEAAEETLDAGEPVLPEVVDALHRAVISPRPELVIGGAGSADRAQLLEYSPDGSTLLALADDGGAMVLDPVTGQELARIPPTATPAFGVAFHPDGGRVLTVHGDGVRQWDWRSGTEQLEVGRVDGAEVSTAAYSPDGSLVAVGYDDGAIRVWEPATSQLVAELAGHTALVTSVDFDPAGTQVLSGSGDGKALVWDLASQEVTSAVPIVEGSSIWQVAWHPTQPVGVLTTVHGEVFSFSTVSGARIASFGNGQVYSRGVAFDDSGSLVVVAGERGFAWVFGTFAAGDAALDLPTGGAPVRDAAFNPGFPPSRIATVGVDGAVRIWADPLGSELPAQPRPYAWTRMAATPDGSRYVFGAHGRWIAYPEGPAVEVVDTASGEVLLTRPTVEDFDLLRQPAITSDGSKVAFAGPAADAGGDPGRPPPPGDVQIVEVVTGETTTVPGGAQSANALSFSADGSLLAGASSDGRIELWDVATGSTVRTLRGHGDVAKPPADVLSARPEEVLGNFPATMTHDRVDAVVFHPSLRELTSAGFDGTVRVWDPDTGVSRVWHQFDYSVHTLAYSPDGSRLAAADGSGTVLVWDTDTGEVVVTPEPVPGWTELAFSPDGRTLAGAGPGPVVHLWDLETGLLTRRLEGAIYPATDVVFVGDGSEVRVASGEGYVRGYVLDPTRLVDLARTAARRSLTDAECQRYLFEACT